MNFDKIYNQVIIETTLRVEHSLVVGSGEGDISPTGVDMPQIKMTVFEGDDPVEVPYIPGSSIKGAVRSVCETIIRTYVPDCVDSNILCYHNAPLEKPECVMNHGTLCMICDTFGCTERASKVAFDDAFLPATLGESGLGENLGKVIQHRTGIVIERKSGKVKPRAMYKVQFIPRGTKFSFNILCTNILASELKLLLLTLRLFNDGRFKLGGQKSRGMGRVEFIPEKITMYLPKLYCMEPFQKNGDGWKWFNEEALKRQLGSEPPSLSLELQKKEEDLWKFFSSPSGQEALKKLILKIYPVKEKEDGFLHVYLTTDEEGIEPIEIGTFTFNANDELIKNVRIAETTNHLEYEVESDNLSSLFKSVYESAFDFVGDIKGEAISTMEKRVSANYIVPLQIEGKQIALNIRGTDKVADSEARTLHDLLTWLSLCQMLLGGKNHENCS